MRHPALFWLPVGLALVTFGCRGSELASVSGEVTYGGQPVEAGMLTFEPTKAEADSPSRNVPIREGRYEVQGEAGLAPGTYLVRITAADLSKTGVDASAGPHARVEFVPLLPAAWNATSKLTIDVKPGANLFHFRGNRGEEPTVDRGPL